MEVVLGMTTTLSPLKAVWRNVLVRIFNFSCHQSDENLIVSKMCV